MTRLPPPRPMTRVLLLAAALLAAACGSVRPSLSPAASPNPVASSAPPATDEPAVGDAFAGLLALRAGELLLDDDTGIHPVAGPGEPIASASIAEGAIAVQTTGGAFRVATVAGNDLASLDWRDVAIDPHATRRPQSLVALSPDARQLAVLGATFGGGEPFEVVLVDLETGAARVIAVEREPNGPPIWLDSATVLLEVVAGAAGGPFVRLDAASGTVEPVAARGFGPAVAGDRSAVALPDAAGGVRVLPVRDWLDGADPAAASLVGAPDDALQVAVDASGRRIALIAADSAGAPVALAVYASSDVGWSAAGRTAEGGIRWIGWLP